MEMTPGEARADEKARVADRAEGPRERDRHPSRESKAETGRGPSSLGSPLTGQDGPRL